MNRLLEIFGVCSPIASVVAVILASFATREGRLIETLAFAVVLSGAAVLLFVKLLGLPIPIWPR